MSTLRAAAEFKTTPDHTWRRIRAASSTSCGTRYKLGPANQTLYPLELPVAGEHHDHRRRAGRAVQRADNFVSIREARVFSTRQFHLSKYPSHLCRPGVEANIVIVNAALASDKCASSLLQEIDPERS
jgi:hypothetical protein